jgi:hypothetical protein
LRASAPPPPRHYSILTPTMYPPKYTSESLHFKRRYCTANKHLSVRGFFNTSLPLCMFIVYQNCQNSYCTATATLPSHLVSLQKLHACSWCRIVFVHLHSTACRPTVSGERLSFRANRLLGLCTAPFGRKDAVCLSGTKCTCHIFTFY